MLSSFILLSMVACLTRVHTGVVASPTDSAPEPAVQVSVHQDLVLVGVAARSMVGSEHAAAALGFETILPPGVIGDQQSAFSPHAALGMHVAQWDWRQEAHTFGAGSPYAQLGIYRCHQRRHVDEAFCFGLSGDAAYHVRFGAENEVWWGGSFSFTRLYDPLEGREYELPKEEKAPLK